MSQSKPPEDNEPASMRDEALETLYGHTSKSCHAHSRNHLEFAETEGKRSHCSDALFYPKLGKSEGPSPLGRCWA